jgi:polysaccharide biosynthesis transport protein
MFDRLAGERDGSWFVAALRRRWWVIALVAVVAAAAGYILSARQTKKYTATSALLFLDSHLDQEVIGQTVISNVDPARQAATNQSLVELPTIARLAARSLGISAGRVAAEVTLGSDAQSDVIKVSVTDPSPNVAAGIANAYVKEYIAFRKGAAQGAIATTEAPILAQLRRLPASQLNTPVGQALIAERNKLDLLRNAQTGDAQVVATAGVPHSPSFPNPKKDGILGLLLGLLVGSVVVTVLERRDRRIKTVEEIEQIYNVPVIGTIPESSALRAGRPGSPVDEESFLMIRAQLRYFDIDRDVRCVMVTSAESGEGKTLVSLNLARAAARADGTRALLIEADMRRPSLQHLIGRHAVAGLAELLSHSQDLATGLRELVITPDQHDVRERPARLDVLLAGSHPPNPVELLESRRMSELIEAALAQYDFVVIDTPPVGVVSDAIPLIRQVDGVLAVSRLGVSRRDHSMRLIKRFRSMNAHLLGVVVDSYRGTPTGDYGYYSYMDEEELPQRRFLRSRQKAER